MPPGSPVRPVRTLDEGGVRVVRVTGAVDVFNAASLPREVLGPRINLSMPGVSCTVGEQIDALRRIAGDKVAARIRREPDDMVARIVSSWPQRFDARRAAALGFRAENTFDDIVRTHIEDELGGQVE